MSDLLDGLDKNLELTLLLEESLRRRKERKIATYFPDTGEYRRELYPKHIAYFTAGARYRERLMMAANRIGKTESIGGYEMVLHMTGRYPSWWEGRKFDRPVSAWAAGDTGKTTRDILQMKLLGAPGEFGTGLIPKSDLIKTTAKAGVAEAIEVITVRHTTGGESRLTFKSYDQRREAFQGSEQDVIWLDEEPPLDVYTECLLRTMTNNGMTMLTFTPLMGMSETVLSFMATWDDVPHLTKTQKDELWASIPPFQRDARSKGVPQLGAGAIYPVPESELICEEFAIPEHWRRCYGMDVGWNRTAVIWGATNPDTEVTYLYSEYYRGQAEPILHAEAIKARGEMPGVIDPASRGRAQTDGQQLPGMYRRHGLDITLANNAVESGLYNVWQTMSAGKLRVFQNLRNWLSEFRLYRRDEKGRVVKNNDHLMDATRYLVVSGLSRAAIPSKYGTKKNSSFVMPVINFFKR
jgi:phage terminase large subunit-like protein